MNQNLNQEAPYGFAIVVPMTPEQAAELGFPLMALASQFAERVARQTRSPKTKAQLLYRDRKPTGLQWRIGSNWAAIEGEPVPINKLQSQLLTVLVESGKFMSIDQILDGWAARFGEPAPKSGTLIQSLHRLRIRFGKYAPCLVTSHKAGYRFEPIPGIEILK